MHTCPGIVVVAVTHLRLSSRLLWVLSFCQHNGRWISPLELPLGAEAPFRTPSGLDFSALGVTCCPACHRFLDLPDEVKSSLPMNKENFAYILGWSDENLTGLSRVAARPSPHSSSRQCIAHVPTCLHVPSCHSTQSCLI